MSRPASTSANHQCPRCGYDQRGVVATWTDACPIEGTCAECGLIFDWSHVLVPHKFEPAWCVEYIQRKRQFLGNCVRTFFRSWRPRRFWSRLEMSHAIHWRRLVLYVLILFLLPPLVLYTVEQAAVAMYVRATLGPRIVSAQHQRVPQAIAQLQTLVSSPNFSRLLPAEQVQIKAQLTTLQQMQSIKVKVTVNHSYFAALYEAVFTPLNTASTGTITITYPGGAAAGMPNPVTAPYPEPTALHASLTTSGITMPTGRRWAPWVLFRDRVGMPLAGFALSLIVAAVLCFGFIFLPVSRRKAKVRWRHVGRVALYGLYIHAITFWLVLACLMIAAFLRVGPEFFGWLAVGAALPLPLLMLNLWWASAIKHYLHMPHGWAIALLLTFVGILLPLTMMFYAGAVSPGMTILIMSIAVAATGLIMLVLLIRAGVHLRRAHS